MTWIRTETIDGIIRLTLEREKTHALDPELVAELREAFQSIARDDGIRAVILTGEGNRFFCNGLDVPALLPLSRPEMAEFYSSFIALLTEMYDFPLPLVAALNGHAMAGGLLLALTADSRLIASGNRYVGLTEVRLGVPVPLPAMRMLAAQIGDRQAHRLALSGEILLPEAAWRAGLANEVTSFRHLAVVAETVAREFAEKPPEAFGITKRYLRAPVLQAMQSRADESREEFLDCWFLQETQATLHDLAGRNG